MVQSCELLRRDLDPGDVAVIPDADRGSLRPAWPRPVNSAQFFDGDGDAAGIRELFRPPPVCPTLTGRAPELPLDIGLRQRRLHERTLCHSRAALMPGRSSPRSSMFVPSRIHCGPCHLSSSIKRYRSVLQWKQWRRHRRRRESPVDRSSPLHARRRSPARYESRFQLPAG